MKKKKTKTVINYEPNLHNFINVQIYDTCMDVYT